jgi:endonuclease YncB( thermonuclease family)
LLVVAVAAFACGFAAAWWLGQAQLKVANDNAAAELALAWQTAEDAEEEAHELAGEVDALEDELWTLLAEVPDPKSEPGAAAELVGEVVGVSDGDTIMVLDAGKTQHRVRLLGIDAPEDGQPFSAKAKQALSDRVFRKEVRLKLSGKDRYQRVLADVYLGDAWINKELVSDGFAWHYKQYDKRPELADAETAAHAAKRGLWIDQKPVPPWEDRHPPPAAQPVYGPHAHHWLNTSSGVRHNESCKHFGNTRRGRFCGPNDGRAGGCCGG